MSSALEAGDPALHKRSVGQIEINGPGGRRKTVDLSDLSQADRELAEKFGYNPVRDHWRTSQPTSVTDVLVYRSSSVNLATYRPFHSLSVYRDSSQR